MKNKFKIGDSVYLLNCENNDAAIKYTQLRFGKIYHIERIYRQRGTQHQHLDLLALKNIRGEHHANRFGLAIAPIDMLLNIL